MTRILLYLVLACSIPANAHMDFSRWNLNLESEYNDAYTAELNPFADRGLKVAYTSSVMIQIVEQGLPTVSGSGNYFRLGRERFILTAAHVVDTPGAEILLIEKGYSMTRATVVYVNPDTDIAVLVPETPLRYTKAIPFRRDINNQVGEKVYHCGHPAREGWHISEGLLSGVYTDTLVVNTFAWPGASGSILFDEDGRVLGVVSAIRVSNAIGIPALVEHLVLVSNIKMLDQDTLKAVLRNGS